MASSTMPKPLDGIVDTKMTYKKPSTFTNCTYDTGGYCVINKNLVLVNIRVTSTTSTDLTISGLPNYSLISNSNNVSVNVMRMDTNTHPGTFAYLARNGILTASGGIVNNGVYVFSCIYLSDG